MSDRAAPPAARATVVVDDLATVRAMSDPLRMRMLELMSRGEWTVKEVAAALGVPQTRLYRHVGILESHGLLRVTGTRLVSGITEKRYAAPARLAVAPRLFGGSAEPGDMAAGLNGLIASAFATIRSEIGQALEAREAEGPNAAGGRDSIMLSLDDARLSRRDSEAFLRRLQDLAAEFEARKTATDGPAADANADANDEADAADVDAEAVDGTEPEALSRYRLLIGFYRTGE